MEMQYKSPVYNVIAVPVEKIRANAYNPNHVASQEMGLLYDSIKHDGYTQPVVCFKDQGTYEIVDGYHRYLIMLKHQDICDREQGKLPIVVINKQFSERMASTIRHNRARGTHQIKQMSFIVARLLQSGNDEAWIAKHLGMDAEEVLRLKQLTGLAYLFKDNDFSRAWEVEGDELHG